MESKERHEREVEQIRRQIREFYVQGDGKPLALQYRSNDSFTIRTKSYKNGCNQVNCSALDQIIDIDPIRQIAKVEPRVTMGELLKASLRYELTVPVIPELKEITVGGAIMGIGAESASHNWGTFNEVCTTFEVILGDGTLVKASQTENPDLFYGIPGSYGSLGALMSAEIKLIPAKDCVVLSYHTFSNPFEALEKLKELANTPSAPDFIDGMIFSKNSAVVIEGKLESKNEIKGDLPSYSLSRSFSPMYYQHVQKIALKPPSNSLHQEVMTHQDYFFRYDPGAFWMGAYLTHFPILIELIQKGIFQSSKPLTSSFSEALVEKYHALPHSNSIFRTLLRPFIQGKNLCKALHKTEKWIQNRFVIQDFCIPGEKALLFLTDILKDPGIFPLWLLPAKGTTDPQIFAPHVLNKQNPNGKFINFGIYGIPSYAAPIREVTKMLEGKTKSYGGRKALYSRSYYNEEEFWSIYPKDAYNALRGKTHAQGTWHEITDKVLSE